MQQSTHVGMKNRTGLQMSPSHSKEMLEIVKGAQGISPPEGGDISALTEMHMEYISGADPLGTIPAPASAKGMAKTGAKMLKGDRPQVFLDKLAERCAFERGGTRLYDGLLMKYRASPDGAEQIAQDRLLEIRNQEAEHFVMLSECIEQLGADPTAQTPGADVVGMEAMGLMQTISDPRTSLVQSLHAVLSAELIDVAGWELLAELADGMGQQDMTVRFRDALQQEQEHLRSVRGWYESMVLQESGKAAKKSR